MDTGKETLELLIGKFSVGKLDVVGNAVLLPHGLPSGGLVVPGAEESDHHESVKVDDTFGGLEAGVHGIEGLLVEGFLGGVVTDGDGWDGTLEAKGEKSGPVGIE